jgi:spore maturation protein CgeB
MQLSFVFLGLSITSSWGNGHATTYRGLVRELVRRGHDVSFLERDVPYYADNRDLPRPPYGRTELYASYEDLEARFSRSIKNADVVVVGSYVPEGIRVGNWVCRTASGLRAFYDIDTPITVRGLSTGGTEYLAPAQVKDYDLYLSFTGGPMLKRLSDEFGAARVRPLYCSADPEQYRPGDAPQYPEDIAWPENVARRVHVAPPAHRDFYTSQRFTLNLTRADMKAAGHSPSVRLFEAAACGTPILTDVWPGLEQLFEPEREIVLVQSASDVSSALAIRESRRLELARRARQRVLAEHTAAHRAEALESYVVELAGQKARQRRRPSTATNVAEAGGES